MNKPQYKVKSMADIEDIKQNGYTVVSTFSGCGGSCLGYRMAGYSVAWANEFIPAAQDTYKANHPNSILDTRDIRKVKPSEILKAIGLKQGELDLFDGSPPCAAFSTSGKREKSWGKPKKYSDTKQVVDDLFFEYVRILKGLRPKVFVAENVSGLIKGTAKGYFLEILKELKVAGYNVEARLLNAKWLGVPQARERLIFIGTRDDLNVKPVYPTPNQYYYTFRDAVGDLAPEDELSTKMEDEIKRYNWSKILKRIPKNPNRVLNAETVTGGGHFNLTRLSWDKPCDTILQTESVIAALGSCHPSKDRKLTVNELRRVFSFPDDFVLTGDRIKQVERIGRSVPPVMMMNIAKTIEKEILCKIK